MAIVNFLLDIPDAQIKVSSSSGTPTTAKGKAVDGDDSTVSHWTAAIANGVDEEFIAFDTQRTWRCERYRIKQGYSIPATTPPQPEGASEMKLYGSSDPEAWDWLPAGPLTGDPEANGWKRLATITGATTGSDSGDLYSPVLPTSYRYWLLRASEGPAAGTGEGWNVQEIELYGDEHCTEDVGRHCSLGTSNAASRCDHVHAHGYLDAEGPFHDVAGLGDVDVATTPPTNGQVLVWDATAGRWSPGSVSGGGGTVNIYGGRGDIPPSSPGTYDEEFTGTANTLPANWAWTSAPSGSDAWYLNSRWASLLTVEGTGNTGYTLTRSSFAPGSGAFGLWTKVHGGPFIAAEAVKIYMQICNSGNTERRTAQFYGGSTLNGTHNVRGLKTVSSSESVAWGVSNPGRAVGNQTTFIYLGLTRDASNNWTLWYGDDGIAWNRYAASESHSFTVAQFQFGIFTSADRSMLGIDWVRYRTDNNFPRP